MLVNAVDSNAEFGVIGVTKKSTLIHYSVFHSRRMDTVFSCAMVATSAGYKTPTYLVPDIQFNMFSLPFDDLDEQSLPSGVHHDGPRRNPIDQCLRIFVASIELA
jgi:hypothetical protein